MNFTDGNYAIFLPLVLALYWLVRAKTPQNLILLCASYIFYGFVHPWICILIAASTVVDYGCGLLLAQTDRSPKFRRTILWVSLAFNLGMLGVFKYHNFFVTSAATALGSLGITVEPTLLQVLLPAGISFYTFQTLSYTIDVFRGELAARKNFLDFAVFVSCFPQLVAGPIERASRLLPQIETSREWDWKFLSSAIPLFVCGFFKKLVVADNLAPFVQQVYMLEQPSAWVLFAGTVAFAIQILADFSAYTDIARGSAKLLGFDLMENFNAPYLSLTPTDFWRRWHISLSTWIRDYLYIPLGGSRVESKWKYAWVVVLTFGLSGLWHGAEWHFVAWGIFHAALLIVYRQLGLYGRWKPANVFTTASAWTLMMLFTIFGWTLFRAPSLAWLGDALLNLQSGLAGDDLFVGTLILGYCAAYSAPWLLLGLLRRLDQRFYWHRVSAHWTLACLIVLLANRDPEAFIYFQF